MKDKIKCALPYVLSIIFFAVLSHIYFFPEITEDKVLFQHDTQQGIALGQEAKAFKEATGETTRWTNTSFSGMPTYQISPSYANNDVIRGIEGIYRIWMSSPVSYLFIMMVGFFIFMIAMKCKWYYAVLGALAYTFSSYFFIIIQAGHIWKFITLAYIPPTIAGIVLAYRGRYLLGGAVATLFATLQLASNHLQMTYYFLFVIVAMVIAYAVELIREKKLQQFLKASGVLIVAAILAVGANLPSLYHTQMYSKESIRGGSELTIEAPIQNEDRSESGLSKKRIVEYSYGIKETLTLLIPNMEGGASTPIVLEEDLMEDVSAQDRAMMEYLHTSSYWGEPPGTSGPVYAGAIICMLFVLGCIIVKSPIKWAMIAATLLSILLSWGKNFMPLTDFFINYFPLYNKFRTVESILVIAEFCMPVLAILALKEFLDNPDKKKLRALYIATGITGSIALLAWLVPSLFGPFTFSLERDGYIATYPELATLYNNVIIPARMSMMQADALRTFIYIILAAATLFATTRLPKFKTQWAVLAIAVLVLFDMYGVNKRYLNSEHFVEKSRIENPFPLSQVDQYILQDTDPNYRVFNLATSSPFSDYRTSYYHKSIGGYHAAKLSLYQDIIDFHLPYNYEWEQEGTSPMSLMNRDVINMLNAKYFILPTAEGYVNIEENTEAMGNAWFVNEVQWVENADAEIVALYDFDPAHTAIIDNRYRSLIDDNATRASAGDTIYLTSYAPNELRYKSHSTHDRVAVFSEVYFPWGWNVTIDGKEVKEARANYVLRALNIPAGDHEIVFSYTPRSIATTETIAYISLALIFVMFLLAIFEKKIALWCPKCKK